MLNKLYKVFVYLFIIFYYSLFFWLQVSAEQWDLLDTAFDWQDTSIHAEIIQWEDMVWWYDSVLINISKFMLKLAAVSWVSMFLIWWIMFVSSFWDQWKMKTARKNIIFSWAWLAIALASIALTNLVQSITNWTLNNI